MTKLKLRSFTRAPESIRLANERVKRELPKGVAKLLLDITRPVDQEVSTGLFTHPLKGQYWSRELPIRRKL